MLVRKHLADDGSASYEWLVWSDDDWTACAAATDKAGWVATNATVTETVTSSGLVTPGDVDPPVQTTTASTATSDTSSSGTAGDTGFTPAPTSTTSS